MPLPGHHHSSSASASHNAPLNQLGTASGIYHAAQTLGSVGAPAGNLRVATTGTTAVGTDNIYSSSGHAQTLSSGGQTAPPMISGLPGPGAPNRASAPVSALSSTSQHFEPPQRGQTFERQPEELHIPAGAAMGQHGSRDLPLHAQHVHHSSQDYFAGGPPGISLQQATPQGSHYPQSTLGPTLPGALQAGNAGRPGPLSTNTAPSTVPTIPQISTQSQQYTTPARSATTTHSHSYSRSSPSGHDQYVPFSNTPENSKYASPPNHKYTSSQTPQGLTSYSPLALGDIRPRADSGLSDGPTSANPYSYDGASHTPTNSNYLAPWAIYAFDWCKWPVQQYHGGNSAGRIAVGSYLEDGHNFIQILDTQLVPEPDAELSQGVPQHGLDFIKTAEATHSYPVTRILWEPPSSQKQSTDLLATSGDHLRLWSLPPGSTSSASNSITRSANAKDAISQKLTPLALLSNSKSPEHTAPLTSLDWNTLSPSLIITSSIDTTCTIWDIPTLTAKTQLIAHDKEVFDVRFCANSVDVFVSCGADGSVRMFDLRSLEHSTIIYEPSEKNEKSSSPGNMSPTTAQQTMSYAPPLLRLAASPHDAHLLATFSQDSNIIRILDVRQPGQALLELRGHQAAINCIEWSPTRRGTLASGADDSLVLIWDLLNQGNAAVVPVGVNGSQTGQSAGSTDNARGPAACWQCDYEVGNISWAPQSLLTSQGGDWLGVSGGRGVWGVSL
ncbi:MAG: hypothetical protein M1830_005296 [Pleopsidium flavum]|nr:MAG: hypothetical protein M1830_005296 [Pleopsidium flavum]